MNDQVVTVEAVRVVAKECQPPLPEKSLEVCGG